MKVAFLGPEGTYTHQAAKQFFSDFEAVPCSSLKEVFEAEADAAVIPFENSLGGGVGKSVDLLKEKDVEITGEERVEIQHVLASKEKDISKVERVRSHPQGFAQCQNFLEEKNWGKKESSSTAKAAEELKQGEAAICSKLAAKLNDLNVLERNIQDRESNITRFFILGSEEKKDAMKTSLILEPGEDRPGLLESMLSCFSGHGINLSYIQSRPTRDGLGNYYFYVEAEEDKSSESFEQAKTCLETYSKVKVLGSY